MLLLVVPFLYAGVSDVGFRLWDDLPLEWQTPLWFAAMYYFIGWMYVYIIHKQEKEEG